MITFEAVVAPRAALTVLHSESGDGGSEGKARAGDVADFELEFELAAACVRGRSALEQVALSDGVFVKHLSRVMGSGAMSAAVLRTLAVEDLYLACACLEGNAVAVATFRTRCLDAIDEGVKGIVSSAEAEDIGQQLIQALLVGTAAAPAKLAAYLGKASLERWVTVAARRAALMWLRKSQAEGRIRRAAAVDPIVKDDVSLETAYIKERYRGQFEQALGDALGRLPERQVVVLRLHLVNGVSVEKIGRMYGVSQSTVSRWLAAARAGLLGDVKETLGRALGTSSGELASLARMVASRLNLTLTSILK